MQLPQPQISVLVSEKTPELFVRKASDVIRLGFGMPSVFNEDELTAAFLHKGKTLQDARIGGINGCVEPSVQGKDFMASSGYFNLPKSLELALNNGVNPLTGSQLGPQTGELSDLETFDDLMKAYRQQVEHGVSRKVIYDSIARQIYAEYSPVPFTSLLMDDCMTKGLDFHAGGAHYNLPMMCGVGTGTMADSLAALKKVVYEDQTVTLEELAQALSDNFEGHERLRQLLINRVPKWGNGDDYVDSLGHQVVELFTDELEKHRNQQGERYSANMIPTTTHIYFGDFTGATPDGRLAHAPQSDGISPVHGMDKKGPTAVIRSMSRLDHERCSGTLFNMKFHPSALSSEGAMSRFSSLIRTYFKLGGHHMQFNVLSGETLRAAQENPEEYKHLIVRVAGYSDYFVRLSKDTQDEIIARTENMSV
jgi:formate C-acetyltransferase